MTTKRLCPSTMAIIPVEKMIGGKYQEPGTYIFFYDTEHLSGWAERR